MSTAMYFDESATHLLQQLQESVQTLTDAITSADKKELSPEPCTHHWEIKTYDDKHVWYCAKCLKEEPYVLNKVDNIAPNPNACKNTACIKHNPLYACNCQLEGKLAPECKLFYTIEPMSQLNWWAQAINLLKQWQLTYKTNHQKLVFESTSKFLLVLGENSNVKD